MYNSAAHGLTKSTSSFSGYATWNPVGKAAGVTLTNGNLTCTGSTLTMCAIANVGKGLGSGKWYWEILVNAAGNTNLMAGVALSNLNVNAGIYAQGQANSWSYYGHDGTMWVGNNSSTSGGASYTATDTLGFALDVTTAGAYSLKFFKNNVQQYWWIWGVNLGPLYPAIGCGSSSSWSCTANFGQNSFKYAPPSGFTAGIY